MNKPQMDKWLRGVFYRNIGGKKTDKISLRHAGGKGTGQGGHLIQEWEIDEKPSDDLIAQLISEIESYSRDDAEGVGGRQRYIVFAHRGEGSEPLRFPFPMYGSDKVGEEEAGYIEGFESEGANAQGLVSQLMRHNEIMMRANIGSMGTILNVQNRMLARLGDLCENLMGSKYEALELKEEVISQKHERDIEVRMLTGKENLQNQAIEGIKMLIPVVMNKIAGKQIIAATDPTSLMIKGLAESLTPEQFQALLRILRPEQQAVLIEMVQATQSEPKPPTAPANGGTQGS
jgi:hypothetical protein